MAKPRVDAKASKFSPVPAPRKPHGMEYTGRSARPGETAREREQRLTKWAEGK